MLKKEEFPVFLSRRKENRALARLFVRVSAIWSAEHINRTAKSFCATFYRTKKVEIKLDMLGSRIKGRIGSEEGSPKIVTPQGW
jgi:hypothetical protein